jgi:dATP pyrophosphohydrolase
MTRCPYQILVLPFIRRANQDPKFCIFKRSDVSYWQGIAGGGEEQELPRQAAEREIFEESGISMSTKLFQLETISSIPVHYFADKEAWEENKYVILNYCFAVEVFSYSISLSDEHSEYKWVNYPEARKLLYWDDNKTALWELNERIINNELF